MLVLGGGGENGGIETFARINVRNSTLVIWTVYLFIFVIHVYVTSLAYTQHNHIIISNTKSLQDIIPFLKQFEHPLPIWVDQQICQLGVISI
jgi:hypothetical protein